MEKENKIDYQKIGLKSGLEIHQQLNTKKLFCSCPSLLRNDEPLRKIKRKLNLVVGETGKIDVAAEYEKTKNKTFEYYYHDTNCLVELDEEPPHALNEEALKITLQICLLLNCKILPVTQIMRKTVIDGSNTSGFQRTVLIGYEGSIETSDGKVGIDTVMLEEDAARPVAGEDLDSDGGNENVKKYRLDRLGIPLVEIATKPDLKTATQIKEAALKIGEILRACKVKRGIGTIRQDVNISIKGSERVEIKGFQDPRIMVKTVDLEIDRQQKCIKEKKCAREVRRTREDGSTNFLRPMPGSARMYPETDLKLLKISRDLINEVKKDLPKLAEDLRGYLKESGLNDELIKLILQDKKVDDFKSLVQVLNNPGLIAKMLVVFPKEISVKNNKSLEEVMKILNLDILEGVLGQVGKKISESDVKIVLQKIVAGSKLEEAMAKEKIDLAGEIEKLIKEKPGLNLNAYMGLMMAKFKGQVSGKEIMDELKKREQKP
mgnify:CR=1 FL=1